MTYAINNTYGGDCTTNDGQDTDGQVVERGVLFFIDDVNGLDFCEEMNFLERLIARGLACS
jgi:hypothetical protein